MPIATISGEYISVSTDTAGVVHCDRNDAGRCHWCKYE